jgi:xylulokinase
VSNWLAIDIGTTQTKAILMTPQGAPIRAGVPQNYPTHSATGGINEQQAEDWWDAAVAAVRSLHVSAQEVGQVVVTGQMQNLIALDSALQPLRPVILYSDTRAAAEATALNAQVGSAHLQSLTGNMQDAGSLLAKLRWLMRYEPGVLGQTHVLLFGAAEFAVLRMTGDALSDTTTASTTGLMDLGTRQYLPASLMADLGLSAIAGRLPRLVAGGTLAGPLNQHAAEALGLPVGLPVHLGPGDAGATTLGAGSGEPGYAYGYIGTSGWVAFTSRQRAPQTSGAFTLAHPRADSLICVAPLLTAGGNLDWIQKLYGSLHALDHARLIESALAQPRTGLLYLPYLNGERSPFSDPFARGTFIGLEAHHQYLDFVRAVLEGVTFAYRHALESLMETPPEGLTLTGGGTRSEAWCQLFADILQIAVQVTGDPGNVGVRGAVIAAEAFRQSPNEAPEYRPARFLSAGITLNPNQTQRADYDRQYDIFRAAYPALKPIFAQMAASRATDPPGRVN